MLPVNTNNTYTHANKTFSIWFNQFVSLIHTTPILACSHLVPASPPLLLTGGFHRGLALTNLESVPEGLFDNTPNLVSLELSDNLLSEVPAGLFANTPKLETLALSRCQISALPAGLFASVPALQSL